MIRGCPTVEATSEDSADTFAEASETFEVIPSTFSSCVFVVVTVRVTSSISGVVPSLIERMVRRSSSNTRPSFTMGSASRPTSTANTSTASSPAISPPSMGDHHFRPCVVVEVGAKDRPKRNSTQQPGHDRAPRSDPAAPHGPVSGLRSAVRAAGHCLRARIQERGQPAG